MSTTRLAFAVLLLSGVAACGGATGTKVETAANGFHAELIGTVDDCRIWRIDDQKTVYFARCPEGPVTTQTTTTCGKGCVRPLQLIAGRP